MLDILLEKAVKAGVKYIVKQSVFTAANTILPGSGEILRAADKGFRRGKMIASGMNMLDSAEEYIENLMDEF